MGYISWSFSIAMSKQPEGNMTEPIEYAGKKIDTTYITIMKNWNWVSKQRFEQTKWRFDMIQQDWEIMLEAPLNDVKLGKP